MAEGVIVPRLITCASTRLLLEALVSAMIGVTLDWIALEDFLPRHGDVRLIRSALASSFVAALELARLGRAEIAQEETFGPLRVRRAPA